MTCIPFLSLISHISILVCVILSPAKCHFLCYPSQVLLFIIIHVFLYHIQIISSPEPKAQSELLPSLFVRRPLCVNFSHFRLLGQWENSHFCLNLAGIILTGRESKVVHDSYQGYPIWPLRGNSWGQRGWGGICMRHILYRC